MKPDEMLIDEIMFHEKSAGYKRMVFGTIEPLKSTIHLYKKAGFSECEPYYHNPCRM